MVYIIYLSSPFSVSCALSSLTTPLSPLFFYIEFIHRSVHNSIHLRWIQTLWSSILLAPTRTLSTIHSNYARRCRSIYERGARYMKGVLGIWRGCDMARALEDVYGPHQKSKAFHGWKDALLMKIRSSCGKSWYIVSRSVYRYVSCHLAINSV